MSRVIKFRVWSVRDDGLRRDVVVYPNGSFTYMSNNDNQVRNIEGDSLEQFTGLKDKNGVEIYEGDIIVKRLIKNERDYIVGSFEPFEVKYNLCGFNLNFMNKHTCEVIGNIHENEDLLK